MSHELMGWRNGNAGGCDLTTWGGGVIKLLAFCYPVTISGDVCLEMVRSPPPPIS